MSEKDIIDPFRIEFNGDKFGDEWVFKVGLPASIRNDNYSNNSNNNYKRSNYNTDKYYNSNNILEVTSPSKYRRRDIPSRVFKRVILINNI